ncbi:MAG: LamG-like jellyroll fold domain-containing protein [Candidatus Gorgyraea atricola]|nr:LamG-like jellyroll fold domain-containing protein [Candidatus Gorgyraea atricola]
MINKAVRIIWFFAIVTVAALCLSKPLYADPAYLVVNSGATVTIDDGAELTVNMVTVASGGTLVLEENSSLNIALSGTITISQGGTLTINGSYGNEATITRDGASGYYTFNVAGTINAQHYNINYTNSSGLNISSTATVTELNYGAFDHIASGGSYITVTSITLTDTFSGLTFNDSDTTATYNINASGAGIIWTMQDCIGAKSGESYDNELSSASITWTTTTPSAPQTPHCEGGTTPVSDVTDITPEFSAIYDDINTSDITEYYEIEVDTANTFNGTRKWDTGKTSLGGSLSENTRCSDISYAGTALSYNTTYYWRIRFWDNAGAQGAWSATQQLTMYVSAGWLGTWAKRVAVTISNTNIDSDLTHFPLLLTLGTSVGIGNDDVSFIFDELTSDANRKKIAVTKYDGTSQIYCEIEKWDDANEEAFLWVSKSDLTLASGSTTTLYLYYDSSQSDNTTYVGDGNDATSENVWDSNYAMVQHLNESDIDGGTDDIKDSSTNDNDGTTSGMDTNDDISAKIGIGFDFDGGNDYVTMGDVADMTASQDFTISGWFARDVDGVETYLFGKKAGSNYNQPGYSLRVTSTDKMIFYASDGTNQSEINTAGAFGGSNWHHVAVVWDDDNQSNTKIYYDTNSMVADPAGYEEDAVTSIGDMSNANALVMGAIAPGATDLDGKIDEMRISTMRRADAWVKVVYYSESDNLVSWGSEENLSVGWLGTWAKRAKVTVSNANIDEGLAHFPLLLTLGTAVGTGTDDISFIFDELTSDANRKKIALTKSDGTTQIYAEIEKWDDANEDAWLWVSKSDLIFNSASDATLYLYYDSSQADNTTYVEDGNDSVSENVWNSNYKLVQHLNESDIDGGTGDIKDSSTNDNDMTTTSMDGNDDVAAKIGTGFDFAGDNDYVTIDSQIVSAYPFTMSSWVKNNDTGPHVPFHLTDASATDIAYAVRFIGTDIQIFAQNTTYYTIIGTTFNTTDWYYVTAVYNSSTDKKLYVNGSFAVDLTTSVTYSSNVDRFSIGRQGDNTPKDYLNGIIDEVRISNTNRPAAWIKAAYYSEDDNLVSWGSEVANSVPSAPQTPYSNNDNAQSGATNPANITDTTPAFSAIYDDVNTLNTSADYQIQVNTDSSFSSLSGWWDANYRYRKKLTVTNNVASIAEAGYSVKTTVDTAALQTASKVRSDRRDWRVAWQPSDTNRSLDFDGSTNYVDIPHNTNQINLPLTISAWVKSSTVSQGDWKAIASKYPAASSNGWNIDSSSGDYYFYYFVDGSNKLFTGTYGYSFGAATTSWSHLVAVIETSGLKLYRDGSLVTTGSWTGTAGSCTQTGVLRLGGITGGSQRFNGLVDDVRIWDVALTQEQIEARMYTRLRGDEPGLAAYFRLDEGSGTVALDSSGNGNHGTLVNSPTWSTTGQVPCAGEIAQHYVGTAETWFKLQAPIAASGSSDKYYAYYDNSDEDDGPSSDLDNVYVFGDDFSSAALDTSKWNTRGTTSYTAGEATVGVGASGSDNMLYSKMTFNPTTQPVVFEADVKHVNDSAYGGLGIGFWHDPGSTPTLAGVSTITGWSTGDVLARYPSTSDNTAVLNLQTGSYARFKVTWTDATHVTFTNGLDSSVTVTNTIINPHYICFNTYSSAAQTKVTFALVRNYLATEPSVSSSAEEEGINPSSWLDANYIYKKQLTVTNNVASIAEAGYSVKTTEDTAAIQTAGKVRSDRRDWRILWEPADTNRSVSFDGSNDSVQIDNPPSLGSAFTLSLWIKPDATMGANDNFIGVYNESGWLFRNDASTTGKLNFYSGSTSYTSASTILTTEEWQHVAVTYDGSVYKLYRNGVNVYTSASSQSAPTNSNEMTIGRLPSSSYEFPGYIDEVRVWNVALTSEQINAHMYTRLRGDEPGLKGYWRLDEGSGTVALDSSGNGNHGTLTNGPTWSTTGQVPCAGEIARDYVGTAETWFKLQEPIAASGSSTKYYAYYDDSDVGDSPDGDLENVYIFSDDFEAGGIDTNKWNIVDSTGWSITGGQLKGTNTTGRLQSQLSFSAPLILETETICNTVATNGQQTAGFWISSSNSFGLLEHASVTEYYYRNDSSWAGNYSFDTLANNHYVKISADSSNNVTLYIKDLSDSSDDTKNATNTISNESVTLGRRYDESTTGQTYDQRWEYLKVRKYLSTDPSISSGSETERGGDGTMMWDSGKTAMTSTNENARCPDITYAGSALSMDSIIYYWRIKFWDNYNAEGVWCSAQQFTAVTNSTPSAPTIDNYNTGAGTSDTTPTLQFDISDPDAGDIIKYQIQIDTAATFDSQSGSPLVDVTEGTGSASPRANVTYTPTALSQTSYYWQVRAIDDESATGDWTKANSGSVAFIVDTVDPTVTGVACYADTPGDGAAYDDDTTVGLQWTESDGSGSGIASVNAEIGDATPDEIVTVAAEQDTDTGSEGANTYYVQVTDNAGLTSSLGNDTITIDLTNPTAPGNLTFNAKTSTSVTLNFGAQSTETNFDQYKIYYKQAASGVTTGDTLHTAEPDATNLDEIDYNSATTATISSLTTNQYYTFNIWAYDLAGRESASATEITVYVGDCTLTSQTIDYDDGVAADASVINWGQVLWNDTETNGSVTYQVEYDTDGDGAGTTWALIPDGALASNSTGFGTSPIAISGLNTTTYNRIRIKATFLYGATATPIMSDWTVAWLTDTTFDGDWQNFSPAGWVADQTPNCTVQARDTSSGLDVSEAKYQYSTNGGSSWNETWLSASCGGSDATTAFQTITASSVSFNQNSGTQNKIKFQMKDMEENTGESSAYNVQTDTAAPSAGPTVKCTNYLSLNTNQWQNTISTPSFKWDGTDGSSTGSDSLSGVNTSDYDWYFGTSSSESPDNFNVSTSVGPMSAVGNPSTNYLRITTYDNVGNSYGPYTRFTFKYDTTNPTVTVTDISEGTNPEYQYDNTATHAWYNSNYSGSLTVHCDASDNASGAALRKMVHPSLGTGWTGGGDDISMGGDYSATNEYETYSWAASAAAPGQKTVTIYDGAINTGTNGNSNTATFTIEDDPTVPAVPTISLSSKTSTQITVNASGGSDGQSSLPSDCYRIKHVQAASYTDTGATLITDTGGDEYAATGNYSATSLTPNKQYSFRCWIRDYVGNTATSDITIWTKPSDADATEANSRSTSTWYQGDSDTFQFSSSNLDSDYIGYFKYVWDTSASTSASGGATWSSGDINMPDGTYTSANSKTLYLHVISYNDNDEAADEGTQHYGQYWHVQTERLLRGGKFFDDAGTLIEHGPKTP